MTSTNPNPGGGPMTSLVAWAAETYDSPQESVASAPMHMAEMGTYSMVDAGAYRAAEPHDYRMPIKGGALLGLADALDEAPVAEAMMLGHSYNMARYLF